MMHGFWMWFDRPNTISRYNVIKKWSIKVREMLQQEMIHGIAVVSGQNCAFHRRKSFEKLFWEIKIEPKNTRFINLFSLTFRTVESPGCGCIKFRAASCSNCRRTDSLCARSWSYWKAFVKKISTWGKSQVLIPGNRSKCTKMSSRLVGSIPMDSRILRKSKYGVVRVPSISKIIPWMGMRFGPIVIMGGTFDKGRRSMQWYREAIETLLPKKSVYLAHYILKYKILHWSA